MKPPDPHFDFDAVFDVDDYIYFYSDSLTPERSEVEVTGLVKIGRLDTPMRILDIPCGIGRHANRLASLGHRVTGVDLYTGFLDLARQDAEARGIQVNYVQGDMRNLDFDACFDRVLMLFTSFGYFNDEDNYRVLQNVARALVPGGLFILDILNRDSFVKKLIPTFVIDKNGDLMIDRINFDTLGGCMVNRRIVIRNGIRKEKPYFVRVYNPNEIAGWLEKANMEIVQMYGGFDEQPVSLESRRLIIVSKRSS